MNQFCTTWRVEIDGFGIVEGKTDSTVTDVVRFLGVPFGQVTKRFEPAELKLKLDDVHKSNSFGPQCHGSSNGSQYKEDCLVLDIFVPKDLLLRNDGQLNPVSVYVHDGAFSGGSSHAWVCLLINFLIYS